MSTIIRSVPKQRRSSLGTLLTQASRAVAGGRARGNQYLSDRLKDDLNREKLRGERLTNNALEQKRRAGNRLGSSLGGLLEGINVDVDPAAVSDIYRASGGDFEKLTGGLGDIQSQFETTRAIDDFSTNPELANFRVAAASGNPLERFKQNAAGQTLNVSTGATGQSDLSRSSIAKNNAAATNSLATADQTTQRTPHEIALLQAQTGSANRANQPGSQKATALMQNAIAAGLEPGSAEYQAFIRDNINQMSPQDQLAVLKVTELQRELQSQVDKEQAAANTKANAAGSVIEEIDRARKLVDGHTTGLVGAILGNIPGFDAYSLNQVIDTIKANIGFDRLQRMRDESPTGGALGQVSELELKLLTSTVTALDPRMGDDELNAALDKINHHYDRFIQAINGVNPDEVGGGGGLEGSDPSDPLGLRSVL